MSKRGYIAGYTGYVPGDKWKFGQCTRTNVTGEERPPTPEVTPAPRRAAPLPGQLTGPIYISMNMSQCLQQNRRRHIGTQTGRVSSRRSLCRQKCRVILVMRTLQLFAEPPPPPKDPNRTRIVGSKLIEGPLPAAAAAGARKGYQPALGPVVIPGYTGHITGEF
jgi:hypothetical protein